jgi:agmatine deiminase
VEQARNLLGAQIETWNVPTNDLWCRDSGPTFVRLPDGELAVSQIQFNGWGQKQEHGRDAYIAQTVAQRLGLEYIKTGLVGEQGGLEHDGAGLVMAHASSWVNANRNAGGRDEIGDRILKAVGGSKIIWAPGIKGADITDYHIDALARFVAPGKVVIQISDQIDPEDPWSRAAHQTFDILKSAKTIEGKPLEIVRLPEPVNIRSQQRDFVASYVNYYVCNGAVVSSQFGDKQADGQAREILQGLYPGRTVVALNTDPIGASGGGIHCATQQQPKARVS